SGELRPVQRGLDRLKEAQKLGFKRALIPAANMPDTMTIKAVQDLEIISARRVEDALTLFEV
ncbi:MAG: DNA repair protein RadA, partial [Gammaproteobacteria bacterium]